VYGSQNRAVVNTYLALAASTVMAAAVSRFFKGKLDVEVILNATLAGGVVHNILIIIYFKYNEFLYKPLYDNFNLYKLWFKNTVNICIMFDFFIYFN